jgi:hypothetical protein
MRYYFVEYLRQDEKSMKVFKEDFKDYDIILGNMFISLAILSPWPFCPLGHSAPLAILPPWPFCPLGHSAPLAILPINKDILKDVFNQFNKLPKNPFIAEAFQLLNGGGIVFTEG